MLKIAQMAEDLPSSEVALARVRGVGAILDWPKHPQREVASTMRKEAMPKEARRREARRLLKKAEWTGSRAGG